MSQLSLFPIRLRDELPADRSKSKDLVWLGVDDQDRMYALKTVEPDNPSLPAVELFCYELCQLCHIPSPDYAVVTRLDGSLAFGSRWDTEAREFRKDETTHAELINWIQQSATDISAMLALDAFLPNPDRHVGNILFKMKPRIRALAFDWSRVDLFDVWPWARDSVSSKFLAWLKSTGIFNMNVANQTLVNLGKLTHTDIEALFNGMPAEWKMEFSVKTISDWWQSNASLQLDRTATLLQQ